MACRHLREYVDKFWGKNMNFWFLVEHPYILGVVKAFQQSGWQISKFAHVKNCEEHNIQ